MGNEPNPRENAEAIADLPRRRDEVCSSNTTTTMPTTPDIVVIKGTPAPKPQTCAGCGQTFPSKNGLFRHLRRTARECLGDGTPEYDDFVRHVIQSQYEKIAVLYGYVPGDDYLVLEGDRSDGAEGDGSGGVEGGEHAASLVMEAVRSVAHGKPGGDGDDASGTGGGGGDGSRSSDSKIHTDSSIKINRSYGCTSRGNDVLLQDANTGAVTEVLCTRAPPLLDDSSHDAWVGAVNRDLERKVASLGQQRQSSDGDATKKSLGKVRVFGRLSVPIKKFNAEMDVTHRRVEYLLPADFLLGTGVASEKGITIDLTDDDDQSTTQPPNLRSFFDALPSFRAGNNPFAEVDISSDAKTSIGSGTARRPTQKALTYLYRLKKTMQRMTTQVVELDVSDRGAVLEKEFHVKKRKSNRKNQEKKRQSRKKKQANMGDAGRGDSETSCGEKNKGHTCMSDVEAVGSTDEMGSSSTCKKPQTESKNGDASQTKKPSKRNVLRRRRFHNFTPKVMAHEFLAYRRMDRFYHRATIRFDGLGVSTESQHRPFLVLSLTGDMFLHGQAQRVIGLFLAICRGVVDDDIIDCIFDEEYTNLVPAPPAPRMGIYAGDSTYMTWEGKVKAILSARDCDRYDRGFNNKSVLQAVEDWQNIVFADVARAWCRYGEDADGRLVAEKRWTEEVLEPWAEKAREQIDHYRQWKAAKEHVAAFSNVASVAEALLPPLESIDNSVPQIFEKVLYYLRKADSSGLWPTTTPKRQLVMVSTGGDGGTSKTRPLSIAHSAAKSNKELRSSAYSFTEGQGGASGSFSVGAMPGGQCEQPKGNSLFPELTKAAFELETALCPDREPSSTIAVNRNAQFRPHTDNGAGAGQSTSLIVGLGTYVGGELVVEGEKKDIRYKPAQFNGWTERHWTLPFCGERYSLVWFTPKGCEGVRGIDLFNK